MIQPPEYFHTIANNSRQRWDQLESDPELAGPWRQLFSQVQSPRHVVSEMLQNADDAGATWVEVYEQDDRFVFEHNGRDFAADDFASLCRFGYSNKRSLHTIGFRGIGFKSLFSLGPTVCLTTPTLSVCFRSQRFTEPCWYETGRHCDRTRIEVEIIDPNRKAELHKSFEQWHSSPLSLLFFTSVRKLTIQGRTIEKEILSDGPSSNSAWVQLTGSSYDRILHAWSNSVDFPDAAIEEIKQERNTEEFSFPPCRVEVVCAPNVSSRVFVVLPTGVCPPLPFSCHGPFIQDPARYGIKDPSISPTNRWLLERVGKLASQTMLEWLDNRKLVDSDRASAYRLLPHNSVSGDGVQVSVAECVSSGFRKHCEGKPVILTDDAELAFPPSCMSIPREISGVWSSQVVNTILTRKDFPHASPLIGDRELRTLESWKWLQVIEPNQFIWALSSNVAVPRPRSLALLAKLWAFIRKSRYRPFDSKWRLDVTMVPVDGASVLHAARDVVRLSEKKGDLPDSEWGFLSDFVRVVENEWVKTLREYRGEEATYDDRGQDYLESAALLKELGLDSPTSVDRIAAQVSEQLDRSPKLERSAIVRVTHAFAALDANVPEQFVYVNRLSKKTPVSQGLMSDKTHHLEEVLPDDFCNQHMLHDDYESNLVACGVQKWREWVLSAKSRLSVLCILNPKSFSISTRDGLEKYLGTLGVQPPVEYQYKSGTFWIGDIDFHQSIAQHLAREAVRNLECWAILLDTILRASNDNWKTYAYATIKEVASNNNNRNAKVNPVPASWIRELSAKPCLRDTYNSPRIPAELLLRTPDTEPLLGIDAFVSADLDTPENRPLLIMLGARDKATGTDRIVKRIQALASCQRPPIHELAKWYEALDRAAARALPQEIEILRKQFAAQQLIWTHDEQWNTSGEVFCFADKETMPEAATIHASVDQLPLWKRLGVADRPSLELIVTWLSQLEFGKLETTTARRVQACLRAFPKQIFRQFHAWISLDQHWQSKRDFRYKHGDGSDLRLSDLFVAAKRNTADLRGIRPADAEGELFHETPDLHSAVKFVVEEIENSGSPTSAPEWLNELGRTLECILLEDKEAQCRVRNHAALITRCTWQPVRSIRVTPYLDNVPVGHSQQPSVLWRTDKVFVRDVSIVELVDDLANELSRPFESPSISEAIRVCIDRTREFVARYLSGKFELEVSRTTEYVLSVEEQRLLAETDNDSATSFAELSQDGSKDIPADVVPAGDVTPSPPTTPLVASDNDVDSDPGEAESSTPNQSQTSEFDSCSSETESNGTSVGSDKGGERTAQTTSDRKQAEVSKPSLLEKYLTQSGFVNVGDHFRSSDGKRMIRTHGIFPLEAFDAVGQVSKRIWMQPQSLVNGLEIPAEVWEMLRKSPHAISIVFESPQGEPIELMGSDLQNLLDSEVIRLFPAKYRLRQIAELPESLRSSLDESDDRNLSTEKVSS